MAIQNEAAADGIGERFVTYAVREGVAWVMLNRPMCPSPPHPK